MKSFSPVGTLTFLTFLEGFSFFGRTSALSPFLPSLCSDLSLSLTQIGGAYMIANLVAGLLLPFVGKCYDRTGLSTFVKAFVRFFAFPFVFIGFFGSLKFPGSLSAKEFLVVVSLLYLTRLPPVTTVLLKNRRSRFLVLFAGTGIVYAFVFMYLVAMNADRVMMIFGALSCFAQLRWIVHSCEEKRYFPLFSNLFLVFINFGISGFFLGWICATSVCIFFIFLVIVGWVYVKNVQINGVLCITLCLCTARLLDWSWSIVCCLCLLLLAVLLKRDNFKNGGDGSCLFEWGLSRGKRLALLFPPFFLLYCRNTFPIWIVFSILTCAFIGIRIAVQAYTLAGRSWLATHFSQRRGFATGCVQLCVTMITASTTVICYQVSQCWTWEMFFYALSGIWLILQFICSFLPDKKPSKIIKTAIAGQSFGGGRVLFVFIWLTLFFRNAQNSGIAFHLVPMCRDFGVNAKTVSAAFMPISLLAVGMTFLFGHLFKQIGSRTILWLFLLSDAGMLYAVRHLDADGMIGMFIGCTGLYWGINNIIASMVIPSLFGVRRIGALNGFAFGALSLGSAVGPFYFGVMKDAVSYQSALTLCIGGVFLLLCLFTLLQNRIKSSEANA